MDMTGPQTRVVAAKNITSSIGGGAGGSGGSGRGGNDGKPLLGQELVHNLKLLVDMTEASLHNIDRKVRHEENASSSAAFDINRQRDRVGSDQTTLLRLREVAAYIAMCRDKVEGRAGGADGGADGPNRGGVEEEDELASSVATRAHRRGSRRGRLVGNSGGAGRDRNGSTSGLSPADAVEMFTTLKRRSVHASSVDASPLSRL